MGSGTPRERETAAHDPIESALAVLNESRGVDRERSTQGGKTARTNFSPSSQNRPPAVARRVTRNVEAGWSRGWLPGMAQRDLNTLKGNKSLMRGALRIGLPRAKAHGG
jgi:hypothetical protein